MPELFQDEIVAKVKGDDFIFAIPSLHDEIKVGIRGKALRQALVGPGEDAGEDSLDDWTLYLIRASATFEVLLKKASVKWPWTAGANGPIVDSSRFPKDKVVDVLTAYREFRDQLTTFREGGIAAQPTIAEAVADQPDTGNVPL